MRLASDPRMPLKLRMQPTDVLAALDLILEPGQTEAFRSALFPPDPAREDAALRRVGDLMVLAGFDEADAVRTVDDLCAQRAVARGDIAPVEPSPETRE
jgi:hypothetical protein